MAVALVTGGGRGIGRVAAVRYPELRGKARAEGRPPQECAELVVRLAGGGDDALSGSYVHVRDDLDVAVAAARSADEPGTLRVVGYVT
jgi:NAD(P)-dependent dehydrogenase (short-subunit alcohol dehydrogenase family)